MNLYEWEASKTQEFEKYGSGMLSILLLLGAAVIVGIALFVPSPVIKALALAYIVLP